MSLKTHEETPDEVARSVAALRELVEAPVPVKEPVASVAEPVGAADGDGAESAASVTEPVEMIEDDADKESLRQARRPDENIRLPEEKVQRPGNEETVTEETKEPHTGKKQGWKVTAMVAASVVGVALLALGIFLLLAHRSGLHRLHPLHSRGIEDNQSLRLWKRLASWTTGSAPT